MSNRDRITRMQEEANAKAKEKPAPKEPKSRKKSAVAASPGRMKIVWAVCALNGSIVKTFPYPEKARAEAEVARLTAEKQSAHHLRAEKVPFE
jgi:hypothetical protein